MVIDTQFLDRCNQTLLEAYKKLLQSEENSIQYDLYRSAVIKEFEVILEQSGKLLKKALADYFHSKKAVDRLTFKDVFRHAGNHGLLSLDAVERWLVYRDNRNLTAHDCGFDLAEKTLPLMPGFIKDVEQLIKVLGKGHDT
ncbi:nucleotidyltransferase substrate binding protein [Facilibium subflavum]|uniref:nucleotidyltransferase substrate binding protein n=1 Tax=Facilibium subflavum TaxID=2219058 RepID=UPI000E6509F4|nr:nucleotidyltransferase substrate binding protein [Facilibium subflavum]